MRIKKDVLVGIIAKEVESEITDAKEYDEQKKFSVIAEVIEDIFTEHREKCNSEAEEQWLRNLINLYVTETLYK